MSYEKINYLYRINPKKNERGICAVFRCSKTKLKTRRICSRCQARRRRLNDFAGYTYDLLRSNAQRRGHEFTITREYFKRFCDETGYLSKKGKLPSSLSINRIDPRKGYIEGNIEAMSLSLNCSRVPDREFMESLEEKEKEIDDLPFQY